MANSRSEWHNLKSGNSLNHHRFVQIAKVALELVEELALQDFVLQNVVVVQKSCHTGEMILQKVFCRSFVRKDARVLLDDLL